MERTELIETWRRLTAGENKRWVLYANGTCVGFSEPPDDLKTEAARLMGEYGRIYPGSSAGDFGVTKLKDDPGWVVVSYHKDIRTYVAPNEIEDGIPDIAVGLVGRSKRDADATELVVIHVEDRSA